MSFSKLLRLTAVVLFLFGLSACGGGTGGGPGSAAKGPLPLPLPAGHGLVGEDITVQPGESAEHGNVVISCPAGGQACVLNVAADGSATYDRTGGMPNVEILPLMAGVGQNLSDASPVFASDETSTLRTTLANPANVLPALSSTLVRDRGMQRGSELSTDFYVKSIRRNASGEYVVNYVLDGTEQEITLDTSDCSSRNCTFTLDGRRFSFWAWTDTDFDDLRHDGLGVYQYLASLELIQRTPDEMEPHTWFVFGVRTEDLPMGTATYYAEFRARSHSSENSSTSERQDHFGNVRLVANFDMRSLNGRIYRVRGRPPGGGTWSTWETSSFTITNGRIVNGQFTATLTGVDTDPTTPFDESARDYVGNILAEFYGPNAEEVGGVVTATRDVSGTADDRVLYGYIHGKKTDPLTGVNDSEALLMAVDRNQEADSTTLTAVEKPTVESTADGFRITYVVDGQTQTVDLGENDFGANRAFVASRSYSKETNGTEFRLSSLTGAFRRSRLLGSAFRPEHFDILQWGIYHRDNAGDITSSSFGSMVYGTRTANMPTSGTANYAGRAQILEWPSDKAVFTRDPSFTRYRGDLNLTADFGGSTVVGNATILETRPGDSDDWGNASGGLSFNATIDGNGLSAGDLSGSGALAGYSAGRVDGAFYGPEAAEVAGVFDGTHDTENKLLTGYFGGQKQ